MILLTGDASTLVQQPEFASLFERIMAKPFSAVALRLAVEDVLGKPAVA